MAEQGEVNTATKLKSQFALTIENFRVGVNAPSEELVGTTPGVPALRFNNVNNKVSVFMIKPVDIDVTQDSAVVLDFALVSGQTNGDVLSITLDYIVVETPGNVNALDQTSTQVVSTVTFTTANGLAAADMYRITFPIDANDATNPWANIEALCFEFHMTNTSPVASIDFCTACLEYEAAH